MVPTHRPTAEADQIRLQRSPAV